MKASALIARLEELIAEHGDAEVDTGGYPGGSVVMVGHVECDSRIIFVIEDNYSAMSLIAA